MNKPIYRIFLLDDDPTLCELLGNHLRRDVFDVVMLSQDDMLFTRLGVEQPHLIVLGQTQAGFMSSLTRLRQIDRDMPVIVLMSEASDFERIIGLELGADDCLDRPPNPTELASRIKAILRRCGAQFLRRSEQNNFISFGTFAFDMRSRRLWRGHEQVTLPTTEFALLEIFLNHPLQMLTRAELANLLCRNTSCKIVGRSIDVSVLRLRRHLETIPSSPRFIQTVRNAGYIFIPNAH